MLSALGARWVVPRVCELGLEPQGTPKRTFLSPIGSPSHHSDIRTGILRRISARISPGGPPPKSQLFVDHLWHVFLGKVDFWPEKNAPARQRRPLATGLGNPIPWEGPFGKKVLFWPEKNATARQRRPVATGLGNLSPLRAPRGPQGPLRALKGP